ncbi:MAG: 30S ribosomal protein S1 [Kiritimatiellae bacterium]|nr:30S ribosomal protein S1 [Kiritimatiellia bacterium]MDD5520336.1 30S ribosomal protein S1 [Kiritimatiellia bacterium]
MAKMYDETMKNFVEGSIVSGTVLEVRPNEVLVDIGYKSEGVIPAFEFGDISKVKPGDKFEVLLSQIEDDNGMVVLSKEKADQKLRWEGVQTSCKEGNIVEGVVKSRVRGGLMVDMNGIDAFLPGSQIDVIPVHNTDAYLGRKYEFKVIKISTERRNIILSRRELIEENLKNKKKQLLSTIEVGQNRKGVVKNITDFGAFVDLDGLDGLLHITDMSWRRVKHPSELVSVGQEIEVVILDVDLDKERVSLGLKQRSTNPWESIEGKYPVGSRLRGKVVNLVPYGAFVELEEGVEGLVHVSEISWTKRIARASDVLAVGDVVDVVVLSINKEEQKIALGIRQTEDNPWDTVQTRYPVGSRVNGVVRNFTSYGAFVELENGIDGMIHVSDMSWTRKINHPSEVLQKGASVEAVVLEVDPQNKRISLGVKQIHDDPWNTIAARYKVGQMVKGKVTKIAAFGAFMEIEEGVDGLVHISEIKDSHVDKVKDVLEVGQDVEARIVRIDRAERRIALSIKAAGMPDEEFAKQQSEIVEGLRPGEDMVDLAGAFDEAMGLNAGEEWRPGEKKRKDSDNEGAATE